jgi:hypothetical protein
VEKGVSSKLSLHRLLCLAYSTRQEAEEWKYDVMIYGLLRTGARSIPKFWV